MMIDAIEYTKSQGRDPPMQDFNISYDVGSIVGTTILEEHVPFAPFIENNFMLMRDNTRPHVVRAVQRYL